MGFFRSFLALTCSLFVLLFPEGLFSPSSFIFCDEGPHLHPLLFAVVFFFFFSWLSLFSWLPPLDVHAAWICPDTASVSGPLCFLFENVWSGSYFCLKYLLGPWKLRTSCQNFPFLSFFSPPLVVFGQPSRSSQPWLLSIVPLFLLDVYRRDVLHIRNHKLPRFKMTHMNLI